jgi:murein L,D-transpeptidase YcbB/YkuD
MYRLPITLLLALLVTFAAPVADAAQAVTWLNGGKPTRQAIEMRAVLDHAETQGLSPEAYASSLSAAELQLMAMGNGSAELANRYETDLTSLTLRFVKHLHNGRVSPRAAGFDLPALNWDTEAAEAVSRLAQAKHVASELESLEPRPLPYRLLKNALARYRQLERDAGLKPLPAITRSLSVGDEYDGTQQLRRMLTLFGDLSESAAQASDERALIDPALSESLRRFQARHGLLDDGVLGRKTLDTLNIPMRQRVRQIELSMERWRWLGGVRRPDIVVNIPQFMLYALPRPDRPGEPLLEIPVIVGRINDRTPIFIASIEQVIFNPYWDVPSSILRNELLPKIRHDVSYLKRHHFEIVRGGGDDAKVLEPSSAVLDALAAGQLRLRQRPGPDNALGPVKFILPNPYSIRLHGTAEPKLFGLSQRAFSHGCIRVSDPAALAEYVLVNAPDKWDSSAVEAALCGTQPRRVTLTSPVRVAIFYATAAATTAGTVLFATDIYGHDARLEKLLASTH